MKDILTVENNMDLGIASTVVPKSINLIEVQLGELSYAETFGIDKKYFLSQPFVFTNTAFKAYVVQRLSEYQINVAQVIDTVQAFLRKYTFQITEQAENAAQFTTQEIIANLLTDADGETLTDADGSTLTDAG